MTSLIGPHIPCSCSLCGVPRTATIPPRRARSSLWWMQCSCCMLGGTPRARVCCCTLHRTLGLVESDVYTTLSLHLLPRPTPLTGSTPLLTLRHCRSPVPRYCTSPPIIVECTLPFVPLRLHPLSPLLHHHRASTSSSPSPHSCGTSHCICICIFIHRVLHTHHTHIFPSTPNTPRHPLSLLLVCLFVVLSTFTVSDYSIRPPRPQPCICMSCRPGTASCAKCGGCALRCVPTYLTENYLSCRSASVG